MTTEADATIAEAATALGVNKTRILQLLTEQCSLLPEDEDRHELVSPQGVPVKGVHVYGRLVTRESIAKYNERHDKGPKGRRMHRRIVEEPDAARTPARDGSHDDLPTLATKLSLLVQEIAELRDAAARERIEQIDLREAIAKERDDLRRQLAFERERASTRLSAEATKASTGVAALEALVHEVSQRDGPQDLSNI